MALYAFTKVTLAIINLIKVRKTSGRVYRALRNISLADALVSIASLQRSMLVSFGDMPATDIQLFNALTGTGVCIIIALLGIEQIVTLKRINKKQVYPNQRVDLLCFGVTFGVYRFDLLINHLCIHLCSRNVAMTHQFLQRSKICTIFQ